MKVSVVAKGLATRLGGARAQRIADAAVEAAAERVKRRIADAASTQANTLITDHSEARR